MMLWHVKDAEEDLLVLANNHTDYIGGVGRI